MPSTSANILEGLNLLFGGHIAMALIVGVLVAKHDAVKFNVAAEKILDLCFWLLLTAIIGSRLIYVFLNPAGFLNDPLTLFEFWDGGLSVSGAMVSAIVVGVVFIKKSGLRLRPTADVMATALAMGHFFVWMGCFFSGICGRNPSTMSGIADNIGSHSDVLQGATADALSLLLACGYFVLYAVLIWVGKRRAFEGQMICIFLALHGVLRFFSETLSVGPMVADFWSHHTVSRFLAASLALGAVVSYIHLWRLNRKKTQRI
jgi:phosphatidylglycerol:prolipoprotein diacylglycerol transferase